MFLFTRETRYILVVMDHLPLERIERRKVVHDIITVIPKHHRPFTARLERHLARDELALVDGERLEAAYLLDPEREVVLYIISSGAMGKIRARPLAYEPKIDATIDLRLSKDDEVAVVVSWIDGDLKIEVSCAFTEFGALSTYERSIVGKVTQPRMSRELRRYCEDLIYEERYVLEMKTLRDEIKSIAYGCVYSGGLPYDGTCYELHPEMFILSTYDRGKLISREEVYL